MKNMEKELVGNVCGDDPLSSIITETGVQLLLRLQSRKCLSKLEPALFAPQHFEAGSVVQISGEANSGKSQLLLHFIRNCIVPVEWNSLRCRGLGVQVVHLDNDRHLSLPRLVGLLEEHFKSCQSEAAVHGGSTPATDQQIHAFVQDCLSRLHLVNGCADSGQFILTLQFIDSFLNAVKFDCSVLIIDSISAFYYEDRLRFSDNRSLLGAHYRQIEALIKNLSEKNGFTVIFARQDLFNSKDFNFLGNSLEKLVSWKIKLARECGASNRTRVEIQWKNNCWNNIFHVFDGGIRFGKATLSGLENTKMSTAGLQFESV